MKHRALTILFLCGSIAAASSSAPAQSRRKPARAVPSAPASTYRSITPHEMQMLLADIAKSNPKVRDRLTTDAEFRHSQIENLRRLLAFASQAEKDGIAALPANKQELENIVTEVVAGNYDLELHRGKPPTAPFSDMPQKRIVEYWAVKSHGHDFERYLDAKFAVLKRSNPAFDRRSVGEDELSAARDNFARMQITRSDYEAAKRSPKLGKDVTDRIALNLKLQRAQFLAKAYADANSEKAKPTDAEVAAFIASHPELSPAAKRAKAEQILVRAKAGEDFANLANQFSEDPGNGDGGAKKGGAYVDVPVGLMVKPFETAALALEPGQIAPQLVESDFGFHIIKLDRKGEKDGKMTYDVRHILISTTVPDPSNPYGRPLSVKDYAFQKASEQKEDKWVAALVTSNGISVPDNFDAPVPPAAKFPKRGAK